MLIRNSIVYGAAPAGPSYDADAAALFARFTADPGATRKGHINTVFVDLKAAGAFPKLDMLQVRAMHDIQSSLLDWKNATRTATRSGLADGAFTVDRGWTTDGATNYLDTGYNPATDGVNYLQNSASFGIRNLVDSSGTSSIAGAYDGSTGVTFGRNAGSLLWRMNVNSAITSGISMTTSAGVYQQSRASSNAAEATYNGGTYQTSGAASVGRPNMTIREGAVNATPSRIAQIAWMYAGSDLSQAEETSIRNILDAYCTALGF